MFVDLGRRLSGIQLFCMAGIIAACSFFFKLDTIMHIDWTFPYLSGAANYSTLFDWQISPSDYEKVAVLSPEKHRAYHYHATKETMTYSTLEYGYVLVVLLARHLFPWLGDIQALIVLQVGLHILISLLMVQYCLNTGLRRGLFFILYAINPVVLHIVTLPFYNFWTVLPSVALAAVWFKPRQSRLLVPVFTFVMLFSLLIRPLTIFLTLFVFGVAFYKDTSLRGRQIIAGSFLCFVAGLAVIYQQSHRTHRSFFHTAYIAIGAYSNPHGIDTFTDKTGYQYYYQKTGERISTNVLHGNFKEQKVMARYNETLKARYLQILHDTPMLLIRNALFNTVQAFGVGYVMDHDWPRALTILIGLSSMCLLFATRQWVWLSAILLYSMSYTPYCPPISCYQFGADLLVVLGVSAALDKLFERYKASFYMRFA
ncbi:MAG: hypothetical protein NXI01_03665 [Gammaproteobacteria bacterium]|nr:hypothetical protein [Gammaproteobacteria bacterium]